MLFSATYLCPVRGLASLEPPEPVRLGQAAKLANSLGLQSLLFPVLEEALVGTARTKISFLDGLVRALDRVYDAGLLAWLMVPAQRIMGLDYVAPHLVRGVLDPHAPPVFVNGRVRTVWPFSWWEDPSIIQKRIRVFREVVSAASGHPVLGGWLVLDRALEWVRPALQAADLVLKSYVAEIRERDEKGLVHMGLGWRELLDPVLVQGLSGQVDGLRMSGLESLPPGLETAAGPVELLLMAAYLGALTQWLFERPVEVEIGWGMREESVDREEMIAAGKRLGMQGLAGAVWLSLIDPEANLTNEPPWLLKPGLDEVGLLYPGPEPKKFVEPWIKEFLTSQPGRGANDFIDLGHEEYLADPKLHLSRLWNRFREWN